MAATICSDFGAQENKLSLFPLFPDLVAIYLITDNHYINYSGQESFRRNAVVLIFNKRVWNAVLGYSLKNDRMILVHFQGKPFNITVIQVYAPTSNAEEAEVEQVYEDLWDLLELTPKKDVFFIIGD